MFKKCYAYFNLLNTKSYMLL